ncbi:MAG: integrase [Nitratiruptor sp.]|nr:integrase [Nitratiruptor sp.]NPA83330.1 tyrosine-type recombinase/integrase [Campylobacterota bacterium]
MRFPLDVAESFPESLLFWIWRYLRFKMATLSRRHLPNEQLLTSIGNNFAKPPSSIYQLEERIKRARNLGIIGIATYFQPLRKLYTYAQANPLPSLTSIDEEYLIEALNTTTLGLSDATKSNHRSVLINFFDYVQRSNDQGHTFDIKLRHWGKSGQIKPPSYLTSGEIARFLEALTDYPFAPDVAPRNRALLKLLLFTGIRVQEAISIRESHLIPDQEYYLIQIEGKGKRYRMALIQRKQIEDDLEEWRRRRRCHEDYLFCTRRGRPLSQTAISQLVAQVLTAAKITKPKQGAHLLRHSFATLLYNKSKDLILVQECLGHANLNTSRIYTHFDQERLKESAKIMEGIGKEGR